MEGFRKVQYCWNTPNRHFHSDIVAHPNSYQDANYNPDGYFHPYNHTDEDLNPDFWAFPDAYSKTADGYLYPNPYTAAYINHVANPDAKNNRHQVAFSNSIDLPFR